MTIADLYNNTLLLFEFLVFSFSNLFLVFVKRKTVYTNTLYTMVPIVINNFFLSITFVFVTE